ncbi:AAA family ATPase [Methylicorpusculum sp.]|uniref:AAA family ATPase n=1 Tax=Methylicorpusculum sp. TaxID=2713644 RepID=UPI0027300826|nr:AAA family ATPase [Methylicorpusculum sp.]MDP2179446.1 AAA family ATPase [Methylicorpusculum sp.]
MDLSKNQLMCIVGKNSVGKTTLIRAIKNLKSADTFNKTASPNIFNNDSRILYVVGHNEYDFQYNPKLKVIDTKTLVDSKIKQSISVELPIPHGERFSHFQRLGEIDEELRRNISLHQYQIPQDLIEFLSKIYQSNRFDSLKEVNVKGAKYYFILKGDDFYIREDYLSSGEHFVINLYKMIQRRCKLIVIDEIDISLDASAQVNLINQLRTYCSNYEVNIVFTTHSLALMKTMADSELYYMESNEAVISFKNVSYNYVKSELFCFVGWDKYILTEDIMLENYLSYLISQSSVPIFFKYKIIYIGGASQVIDLMARNTEDQLFSTSNNVICVLDGDTRNKYENHNQVYFIPFNSVEKQLFLHYSNGELPNDLSFKKCPSNDKELFNSIIEKRYMTDKDIFDFINNKNRYEVEEFKSKLIDFLTC